MVTVIQSSDETELYLKSHFYYSERLRELTGARWNPDLKVWCIPCTPFNLNELENTFKGELFFKTPKWVITKQPMPNLQSFYKIPDSIQTKALNEPFKLFEYQNYGSRFAIDRINKYGLAIIADGCGLGKTLQGIAVLSDRLNKGETHFIIVCKKSIKQQWNDEIRKFGLHELFDDVVIEVTGDTAKKRQKAYESFRNANKGILITNYQTFLNDEDKLMYPYDFLIVDEAHTIANHETRTNQAMTRVLQNIPALFLTGTPIQSKPEQIYGIVNITTPNYFGKFSAFEKRYLVKSYNGNFIQTVGVRNLDELRSKIQDIMIRRTEYEVQVELPDVTEKSVVCKMDKTQQFITEQIIQLRSDNLDMIQQIDTKIKAVKAQGGSPGQLMVERDKYDALIKGLIAAAQATADDPRMFHSTTSKYLKKNFEQMVSASYSMSSKVESVIDICGDIFDAGEKVIIFSKFTTSLNLIANDLKKKYKCNILFYTGQQGADERTDIVAKFKTLDEYPVLLCTEAAAEGINLNVTRHLINFNLPDTAAIYTQRIGRIRRVGSAYSKCIVYNMITQGSKDEARWENIQKNRQLEDAFINVDQAQSKVIKDESNK